ncbi:hypothetical protein EVAR_82294_1 [Eumeta japonica]|uniref:Uncharacterized protein n=1 Tax=Eumeta variegata TaxID=151549 RepID=A0A4C1VZY6_EUMVA|nr:hypothetical protein EVAR_82294_1 [Eumeta japonica]
MLRLPCSTWTSAPAPVSRSGRYGRVVLVSVDGPSWSLKTTGRAGSDGSQCELMCVTCRGARRAVGRFVSAEAPSCDLRGADQGQQGLRQQAGVPAQESPHQTRLVPGTSNERQWLSLTLSAIASGDRGHRLPLGVRSDDPIVRFSSSRPTPRRAISPRAKRLDEIIVSA